MCRSYRRCFILGFFSTKVVHQARGGGVHGGSVGLSLPRGRFLERGTYRIRESLWLEETAEIIKSSCSSCRNVKRGRALAQGPAETCVLVSSWPSNEDSAEFIYVRVASFNLLNKF